MLQLSGPLTCLIHEQVFILTCCQKFNCCIFIKVEQVAESQCFFNKLWAEDLYSLLALYWQAVLVGLTHCFPMNWIFGLRVEGNSHINTL